MKLSYEFMNGNNPLLVICSLSIIILLMDLLTDKTHKKITCFIPFVFSSLNITYDRKIVCHSISDFLYSLINLTYNHQSDRQLFCR